jgi:hypothetical protein
MVWYSVLPLVVVLNGWCQMPLSGHDDFSVHEIDK